MAIYANTGQFTSVNAIDYTSYLKGATLSIDVNQLDSTDFASGGWVEMIGGLRSASLSLEFMDDFDNNTVDSRLFALLGTVVNFVWRATSAAIGVNNPEYRGSVLITQHTAGGNVGDLGMKSLTFPISGAVTRHTT
jgi:hypothetical protein